MQHIIEGVADDVREEDDGQALILTVRPDDDAEAGLFCRLQSWYPDQSHFELRPLIGRRLRVTVEIINEERLMATKIVASAAIVLEPPDWPNGRPLLLLLKRGPMMRFLPNHIDLPGGTREEQETVVEAAVRETLEEVNLDLEGIDCETVHSFDYAHLPDHHYTRPVYATNIVLLFMVSKERVANLRLTEHEEPYWIGGAGELDALLGTSVTPEMRGAIESVFRRLEEKRSLVRGI